MDKYNFKHTGAVIDQQIDRVIDGSVVVDNTLSALDENSNKPVDSTAVNTEFNDRNGKYRITDLELRDNGVYLGTIWDYNSKGVSAQGIVLNTFYSMGPLSYLCFNRKKRTVSVKSQESATVDDDILFIRNGQSSYLSTALLLGVDLLNKTHKLNIECVHGGCWAVDGNIYAETDSTEKVRMRSLGYYAINGISDKIVEVVTPTGVAYSIVQYDSEFNFVKFNSRYDKNLNATCRYVRFVLAKEDSSEFTSPYVNITVDVSSKNPPKFYPTKREGDMIFMHYAVGRPIIPEFSSVADGTATTDYNGDNALLLNKGYIALPPNYTPMGNPCPVIIYCHGTSGFVYNNNYLPTNEKYVKFLAKCGYAVIGCSTFTDEFKNNADDGNFPDMRSRACYEGLWNIMTKEFNLDKSGAYVLGFSAGGMNTLMLSYNNNIPVKVCALLAGSIDIICNMRILADYCCEYFFNQIGLSGRDLPTGLASDEVRMHPMSPTVTQDIIDNWQYFVGLNPFCFNSTLDYEAFLEKYALVNNSTTVLSNDDELNAIVSEAKVFFPKPIKIWHAVDDVNVPIQISRWWRDMVQRGGGCCYLREFPGGCGAHYAVGSSTRESELPIPMTAYTTKYGEVINSIPVAYAELVDWFNQW